MGYETVALNQSITGKVPAEIVNAIPDPLPLRVPSKLKVLRRCTLHLSDPSQNHRLSQLSTAYDLFVLRPMTEKAFQQACLSLECDIISLDFNIRHPFYFQIKTVKAALERGIKFEICYAPGILNSDNGISRRNLLSNATQLIRATRGSGIVISSEAKRAVACRSPADIINLSVLWGLTQERGLEAVGREARSAVIQAGIKRRSFRGVIDFINPGTRPERLVAREKTNKGAEYNNKRKADHLQTEVEGDESLPKPISKREQKRRDKKAQKEVLELEGTEKVNELNHTVTCRSNSLSNLPQDRGAQMPNETGP